MLVLCIVLLVYQSLALPKGFGLTQNWGNKYTKFQEKSDKYLSLIDEKSNYMLVGVDKVESGYLFNKDNSFVTSKFSVDNQLIDVFIPMQIQRKNSEISFALTENMINGPDVKSGKNGLQLTLKLNSGTKDEVILQHFNDKENRIDQVHSLSCKGLKSVPRSTALHIVYNGELNTISTELFLDSDQVKCSSENFIKIPKKLFISVISRGFEGIIKEVLITNKSSKKDKKPFTSKQYTIEELKGKNHNQIIQDIYKGIEGLYLPLVDASKGALNYDQQVKNLKHYVRDTIMPECGDVETPINIQQILDKINAINVAKTQDSIKTVTQLDAFNELSLETRNPTSFLFWFITLGVQAFTILALLLILKRKKNPSININ